MRRTDREKDRAFALEVIDQCAYGTVAFTTDTAEPYCIPLSLVRIEDNLYFHCALKGTKMDLLRRDARVCISFVSHNLAAADQFTTYFKSAVVKGRAVEVTAQEEKIQALRALCQKLTPSNMVGDNFERAISKSLGVTAVWRISMEEITGKEKI